MPLINGADRTLRWFIEDGWAHFDDDHTRPGAPLFPSERKNADSSCKRIGDGALPTGRLSLRFRGLPASREPLVWARS